jgi:hypothetical protein
MAENEEMKALFSEFMHKKNLFAFLFSNWGSRKKLHTQIFGILHSRLSPIPIPQSLLFSRRFFLIKLDISQVE